MANEDFASIEENTAATFCKAQWHGPQPRSIEIRAGRSRPHRKNEERLASVVRKPRMFPIARWFWFGYLVSCHVLTTKVQAVRFPAFAEHLSETFAECIALNCKFGRRILGECRQAEEVIGRPNLRIRLLAAANAGR
jgi:hypothetical protein